MLLRNGTGVTHRNGTDAREIDHQLGGEVDFKATTKTKAPQVTGGDGEPKTRRVDRRLAYLLSCSIRFELVQRGELTLDQAIDDVERLRVVAGITCRCEREILDAFERYDKRRRSS
jgi:hypothetical protein